MSLFIFGQDRPGQSGLLFPRAFGSEIVLAGRNADKPVLVNVTGDGQAFAANIGYVFPVE